MRRFRSLRLIFTLIFFYLFLGVSACDNTGGNSGESGSVSNLEFRLAPNATTPLAGLLSFNSNVPTRASLMVSDGMGTWTVNFDDLDTVHSVPVLGFRPEKTHTVKVSVFDEGGNVVFEDEIEVMTDPLPEGFPPISVVSNPEMMEPGVTIFTVRGRGANSAFGGVIVAVNELGEVVWYHKNAFSDVRRLSNGNLLFFETRGDKITEIDMLGNVVQTWHPSQSTQGDQGSTPIATREFHHEVSEMINGNFLVLGFEVRSIDNYPSSDSNPVAPRETANVVGDLIIEFARDGTIVDQWSLLDLLDPLKIGYGSLSRFYDSVFPEAEGGTRDWSHGNAVIHDQSDNSILVSARNIDAVIKFSRETRELIWILGAHENWNEEIFGDFLLTPVAGEDFLFQYHQHAHMVTPDGNILVFDNGNFRASPFDEKLPATENFSRAVEYSVNEESMEVRQAWEYGQFADEILYAPFLGDADLLPITGNVLITFGGIAEDDEGNPTDSSGGSKVSVRIIEVTHTTPGEKVFDLSIVDSTDDVLNGWSVYRAERLSSLYP